MLRCVLDQHCWLQNRFEQILRYLHASDSTVQPRKGTPAYDPLYKARHIIDTCNSTWAQHYKPDAYVAVDEAMAAFMGRVGFKTRMPKAHDVGVRAWLMAESRTGYALAADVKCDKYRHDEHAGRFEGTAVTMGLLKTAGLEHRGHVVVTDNYYTSAQLCAELKAVNTYAHGIIRTSRVPRELQWSAAEARSAARGTMKHHYDEESGILLTSWKDARVVYFLSTATGNPGGHSVKRWFNGTRHTIPAPFGLYVYNLQMGPVDHTVRGFLSMMMYTVLSFTVMNVCLCPTTGSAPVIL